MAIALVQQANNATAAGTSVAVTIAAPAAGSALVACIAGNGATTGVLSVSGGGVTWAQAEASSASNYYAPIWYGLNSSGSGTTVTVTTNASGRIAVIVTEWSGVLTAAALDVHGNNQNAGSTTATPGSLTESASGLYIYNLAHGSAGTAGAPNSSFTALTGAGTVSPLDDAGYLIQTSPAATNPSITLTASTDWDEVMIVLLAAAATDMPAAFIGGGFF